MNFVHVRLAWQRTFVMESFVCVVTLAPREDYPSVSTYPGVPDIVVTPPARQTIISPCLNRDTFSLNHNGLCFLYFVLSFLIGPSEIVSVLIVTTHRNIDNHVHYLLPRGEKEITTLCISP